MPPAGTRPSTVTRAPLPSEPSFSAFLGAVVRRGLSRCRGRHRGPETKVHVAAPGEGGSGAGRGPCSPREGSSGPEGRPFTTRTLLRGESERFCHLGQPPPAETARPDLQAAGGPEPRSAHQLARDLPPPQDLQPSGGGSPGPTGAPAQSTWSAPVGRAAAWAAL